MYLVLAKFKGDWVISQIEDEDKALQVYKNQASKVGIWAEEAILFNGNILNRITESEVLEARGYPIDTLKEDE